MHCPEVSFGLGREAPDLLDTLPALSRLRKHCPAYVQRAEASQRQARRFARVEILPRVLEIDRACELDPTYVDWDLWRRANREGFPVGFIPEKLGGLGWSALDAVVAGEEFSSACIGVSAFLLFNTFGLLGAMVEFRPGILLRVIGEMVRAQKQGRPLFWAWAITEPGAGTDMEDGRGMAGMRPSTWARRVEGGYQLNGTKCFITNGSLAHYVIATIPLDRSHPRESMATFLVPTDSRGFRVGRVERKCGQKASQTAELFFDEVWVPEENLWEPPGRGLRHTREILSATRGFVGLVALGIARGALERCLRYACRKRVRAHRLIEEEWVQIAVAGMLQEIDTVRAACYNFAISLDTLHVLRFLQALPVRGALKVLPAGLLLGDSLRALASRPRLERSISLAKHRLLSDEQVEKFVREASAVKVAGTDLAVRVTSRVLDIVGLEGMERSHGMEKCFRDAKVTQIYEGTNQANLLDVFDHEVGRRAGAWGGGGDG